MGQGPVFPQRAADIIDAFLAVPAYQALAKSANDNDRRQLTLLIVAQLVYEFPNGGYCAKSADPGRPQSKDAIALRANDRLYSWDWQNGETRQRQVKVGQEAEDITGQNPIVVTGVNTLGLVQNPHTDPPPTDDATNALAQRVFLLEQKIAALVSELQALDDAGKALAARAEQTSNVLGMARTDISRIDSYLALRPIPTGVKTGGALGRYVGVALTFDTK